MKLNRRHLTAAFAVLFLGTTGLTGPVLAQEDYPTKPISMLVGYNAGGQTDLVARAAAQVLSAELGQPINVINRPGAGGAVAAREVTQAEPDGYTMLFHANSVVNAEPFLMKRVNFTPDDFEWAGFITAYQVSLAAPASAPYDDLDEFIAWGKENPGFSVASLSPTARMMMNEIAKKEGLEVNYVPVKGGGDMVNTLLGNQVAAAYSGGIHVKYPDQIKTLATLTTYRQPSWPDVKSIEEYGYPLAMDSRAGVMLPKGTPQEIVQKISDALAKAETDETFLKVTGSAAIPVMYMNAQEARAEMDRTCKVHGEIFRKAGIEPQ